MEQKTEASQAVDEREQFEQWAKRRGHDIVSRLETGGKFYNSSFTTHLWVTWQASRAALKVQPAPTEAAQGGKLLELFKLAIGTIAVHDQAEAERIAKMYRSDAVIPASVAAQGEDSARLDAYQLESMSYLCGCKACNQIMTGRMMFICGKCGDKNCPGATNHLNKCIDRARASAETGGVKS